MNDRDFNKDIEIDEYDLEGEWIEQPSLYLYYAEAHAEAVFEKDKKKSQLDYTYSLLYDEIKSNWEQHFDKQPTEPAIKEWIIRHKKYRNAEKNFIESTRSANVMLNVKIAFDHRKRALESLVSLRTSGFNAEPKNRLMQKRLKGGHAAQKEELKKGDRAKSRKQQKK